MENIIRNLLKHKSSYNYQMDSLSISYEDEFLAARGIISGTTCDGAQDAKAEEPVLDCLDENIKQEVPDIQTVPIKTWVNLQTNFKHEINSITYGSNNAIEIESVKTLAGEYIGDSGRAAFLHQRGIVPQLASPKHKVCSIGYCARENKWYGWSHRAMFGFGIGSGVRKGDCAYMPDTKESFIESLYEWHNELNSNKTVDIVPTETGAQVNIKYPNSGYSSHEEFIGGNGEWQAKTMIDAKRMATDFAESVSSIDSSLLSESAKEFSPSDYVWYTYTGNKTSAVDHHVSKTIETRLHKGEKFGIYYNPKTKMVHFVEASEMGYEFRVTATKMKSWLKKAKPFGGRINGQKITRGNSIVTQNERKKLAVKGVAVAPVKIKGVQKKDNGNPDLILTDDPNDNVTAKKPIGKKPTGKIAKKPKKETSRPLPASTRIKRPVEEEARDILIAYFKPNAEVENFAMVLEYDRKTLLESTKLRMDRLKNLGSKATIIQVKDSHRLIQRMLETKYAIVSPAHMMVILKDNKYKGKPMPLDKSTKILKENIQFAERSPDALELNHPIFIGNDVAVLSELRTQVINMKRLSANMSLREKKSDRAPGILKSGKGQIFIEFVLPNDGEKSKVEAANFIRRLSTQSERKLLGVMATFKRGTDTHYSVRVVLNTKPFSKAEDADFAKRLRALERNQERLGKLGASINTSIEKIREENSSIAALQKELSGRERASQRVEKAKIKIVEIERALMSFVMNKTNHAEHGELQSDLNKYKDDLEKNEMIVIESQSLRDLNSQIKTITTNIDKLNADMDSKRAEIAKIEKVGILSTVATYNTQPSSEPALHVNFVRIDYSKPALIVTPIRGPRIAGEAENVYSGEQLSVRQLYDMSGKTKII